MHLLEFIARRKYLQEAKLQPKIKFTGYGSKKDEKKLPQEQESKKRVYELAQPRHHQMGKAVKTKVKRNKTSLSKKVVKNRKVRTYLTVCVCVFII